MKPSVLIEALHALIGQRVSLHIWGACGVGKSQIVAQVASEMNRQFLDVRAVQLDPVDLRGLPRISADQAEWVPPKFLPTSGEGMLFLDELTSAPQMTQAGCYQLPDFEDWSKWAVKAGIRPEIMVFLRFKPTLRKKFGLKLEVWPIPSGDDFRVTMSAEEQARVAREIDANVRQSVQKGTEDLGAGSRAWSATWPTGSTNRNPDSMHRW
jgi:hypothetical protein